MFVQVRYVHMLGLELLMGLADACLSVAAYCEAFRANYCIRFGAAILEDRKADKDVLRLAQWVFEAEGPGAIMALHERIYPEAQLSWTCNIPSGGLAFDMLLVCDDVPGDAYSCYFSLANQKYKFAAFFT